MINRYAFPLSLLVMMMFFILINRTILHTQPIASAATSSPQAEGPAVELQRKAQIQRLSGDYAAACKSLKQLIRLQPANSAALYELGLLLAASQPESAPVYLEQAARQDVHLAQRASLLQHSIQSALPEKEPAFTLVSAGRALGSLGEWRLAEAAFQQAVSLRPDYAEGWAFLGYARYSAGGDVSNTQGLIELQKALSLDPNLVSANTLIAVYWRQHTRPDLASQHLQKAASLDPTNPAILVDLGESLALQGDLTAAQAQYQRAADMNPGDPTYWRLLADFVLRYNLDTRQLALTTARKAVLLAPNDAAALDTLGKVYISLGDLNSARRLLRRALQSDPGYAPAYLNMGIISLLQGDEASAMEYLSLARDLTSDPLTAAQAQRLLDSSLK